MTTSRHESVHRAAYLAVAAAVCGTDLLGVGLEPATQVRLLAVLVFALGVPHGALDPLVVGARGVTLGRMSRFLAGYVLLATLAFTLWWLAPAPSLCAFLVLSLWHFSSDWEGRLPRWQAVSGAAAVISLPAFFHPAQTGTVFAALVPPDAAAAITSALGTAGPMALGVLALVCLQTSRRSWPYRLELASLPLLAWSLEPMVFFIVYFCGLHSPRHLLEAVASLDVSVRTLLVVIIPITAVTGGLAVLVFVTTAGPDETTRMLRVVFMGLAALTVPHMCLVDSLPGTTPTKTMRTATAAV